MKNMQFALLLVLLLTVLIWGTVSAESVSFPEFIYKSRLNQNVAALTCSNSSSSNGFRISILSQDENCTSICGRALNGLLSFREGADAHLSAKGSMNPDRSYKAGGAWQLKSIENASNIELLYSPYNNSQSLESDVVFIYLLDSNNEVLEIRYLVYECQENGTGLLYEMQL